MFSVSASKEERTRQVHSYYRVFVGFWGLYREGLVGGDKRVLIFLNLETSTMIHLYLHQQLCSTDVLILITE